MKRWLISGLLLLCLALVSLTACGGSAAEAQQQLVEVTRGDILLSITAEGNLSLPWHRQLTFGTIGTVATINVEKGDKVTKGQVMASLDTTSLEQTVKTRELAVKSAEIDLESAQNSLAQLTTPYPFVTFAFALPESLDEVRLARQRIKEAQEELVLGLEGEPYDMAEMKEDLRQAQESLTEAESKLAAGLGQGIKPGVAYWTLRAAQMAVDKAQVALDNANNELEKAKSELEKAIIVAPFTGVVADVNVKEGDKLSSMDYATKTIIELIDPTIIELKAELDEIDVPEIKLNQRAIIEIDALPDLQIEGEVTYIYPVSIEESGVILYQVIISFDLPSGSVLKSGMSATADIIMDERSQVLLVPDRAIEYDEEGNTVVQVMVDEQIEERAVVAGISDGYQTEIVDGLNEGEIVVIEVPAKTGTSGFFQ
jgi:HlyD family secretion protein